MLTRILSLLALCALASGQAQAQTAPAAAPTEGKASEGKAYVDTHLGYARGADVINRCIETSTDSASFCFAYIAAVYDRVRAYETWLSIREFCIPADTPQGELRDVVVAHIEAHPNDRLGQGASVVIRALKEHYPCAAAQADVPAPAPAAKPQPARAKHCCDSGMMDRPPDDPRTCGHVRSGALSRG